MSRPILAYWDIRGLAQPIRHLLVYVGVDFENKEYKYGPPPDLDPKEWFDVKDSLGLAFPNLPYYIDGDLKITQSDAILQHLGRKHGLYGQNDKEKIIIDTLTGVLHDFFNRDLGPVGYDLSKIQLPDFKKTLADRLKTFSDYLGTRTWFTGDKISFIDFKLYEIFRIMNKLDPGCADKVDNIKKFGERFEGLPAIAKYMKSPEYRHKPFSRMLRIPGDD